MRYNIQAFNQKIIKQKHQKKLHTQNINTI